MAVGSGAPSSPSYPGLHAASQICRRVQAPPVVVVVVAVAVVVVVVVVVVVLVCGVLLCIRLHPFSSNCIATP